MSARGIKAYSRSYGLVIGGALHIMAAYNGMHAMDRYLDHREDAAIIREAGDIQQPAPVRTSQSIDDVVAQPHGQEPSSPPRDPLQDAKERAGYGVGFALGAELYRVLKSYKRTHGGRLRDVLKLLDFRVR